VLAGAVASGSSARDNPTRDAGRKLEIAHCRRQAVKIFSSNNSAEELIASCFEKIAEQP
jgi:hypothetical protein